MWTPGGQIDLIGFHGVYGGGKGGSAPQAFPPTFTDPVNGQTFTSPAQLNDELRQRQATEKTASDQAAAQAATDAQTKETNFQGSRQTAYNDALTAVQNRFKQEGVDPASYMDQITPVLQRQFNSIQDLDPNPSAAFAPSLADTILGNAVSGKRTGALNTLNSTFTPGYVNNLLPDTTPSNFVNDILNEQFNPLEQQLTNAQKRGTLGPAGFTAAENALGQKRSAAQSQVQNLGQGILSSDRTDLSDLISGARNDVSNLSLGQSFDPSTYFGQAQGKAATDLSGFGGALRSAVGDTKFATLQELLNAGGAVQGANNPTATNPIGIGGTIPEDPNANLKRGLGNTGAF